MGVYENKRYEKAGDGTANYVTAKTLTTAFVEVSGGAAYIDCAGWDEMSIYYFYHADGIGDILTTRVDFSADQTSWCPEADEVVTAGAAAVLPKTRVFTTLTADEEAVPVASVPLNDRWARIMAKDDTGGTGSLRIQIILSKVSS